MKIINFAVLLAGFASAIIESIDGSCGSIDTYLINLAINDAIAVAGEANTQLSSFDTVATSEDDPRVGIYNPLFNPGDKQTILGYLSSIANIRNAGYKVRIYCEDNSGRIKLVTDPNTQQTLWVDTDFYHNPQPKEARFMRVGLGSDPKPLATWTRHGRRVNGNFDTSNQAHIQLSQNKIDGVTTNYDNRAFADIRANGLIKTGNKGGDLDYLRPLSRTIIHELFHVVGGLDATGGPVVIDVPKPLTNPPRNYGTFNDCMSQKNAPVPSVRQAECLTILAVGLYLDEIQGKPAFWSLGRVNPTTLQPLAPAAAASAKVKARAKAPFGIRGSHWG